MKPFPEHDEARNVISTTEPVSRKQKRQYKRTIQQRRRRQHRDANMTLFPEQTIIGASEQAEASPKVIFL